MRQLPEKLDREFSWRPKGADGDLSVVLSTCPGAVMIPGIGLLSWEDTRRFSRDLDRLAHDARFFGLLREDMTDMSRVCTICNKDMREGIATTEDEEVEGRLRHVAGAPGCARSA